jgi:hypothetical protein
MDNIYAFVVVPFLIGFFGNFVAYLCKKSKISQARERQAVAAAGTQFTKYRSFCKTVFFDILFVASCYKKKQMPCIKHPLSKGGITVRPLSFRTRSFRPGHFVPSYISSPVISSPDHFVP